MVLYLNVDPQPPIGSILSKRVGWTSSYFSAPPLPIPLCLSYPKSVRTWPFFLEISRSWERKALKLETAPVKSDKDAEASLDRGVIQSWRWMIDYGSWLPARAFHEEGHSHVAVSIAESVSRSVPSFRACQATRCFKILNYWADRTLLDSLAFDVQQRQLRFEPFDSAVLLLRDTLLLAQLSSDLRQLAFDRQVLLLHVHVRLFLLQIN